MKFPTMEEVSIVIDKGGFLPRRSEDGLVLSTISTDKQFRKVCTFTVRVDYEDKKLEEVTRTVIQRYRFIDDAYQAWTQSLMEGTRL